jgi:hypothetical protein
MKDFFKNVWIFTLARISMLGGFAGLVGFLLLALLFTPWPWLILGVYLIIGALGG